MSARAHGRNGDDSSFVPEPSRKGEPRSTINNLDEAMTKGTPYASYPTLEAEAVTRKDVEDYRAIALVAFLVSAFAIFVCIVYTPNPFLGAVIAAIFVSFLIPLGLAMQTMKKRYLAIGLLAFGLVFSFVAVMAILGETFHVGPLATTSITSDLSPWDVLFLVGIPPMFFARRVLRRRTPIYGLR